MQMNELLPCPFCWGEAKIHASHHGDTHYYQIECGNEYDCGAWPAVRVRHTEAEAITAWNSRAERTCHIDGSYYDELFDETCTNLSCGHAIWQNESPNYCSECGAKVIGG